MDTTGKRRSDQNDLSEQSRLLKSVESFKARHKQNRTFSERLADSITSKSGSMTFLTLNVGFFLIWIVLNQFVLPEQKVVDPFPFPALTTIVSLEAIFLAIVVLISQNREMKIQDLRQEINLHIDMLAEREITKLMNLVEGLFQALNIPMPADPELQEMSKPTDPEKIERELKQQEENAE